MKRLFIFFLLAPAIALHAQNGTDSLSGAKSDSHIYLPGTHLSIILPQGFKVAKDFIGIEKDDKTYIEVFDPYESDYNKSASYFTRPLFESKGMDVFTFKTLSVGHYTARYAGMKSNTGYHKYELLFGDTTFSVMVMGHCSVNDDVICKALESAILSVSYNKDKKVNPYIHTYFTLNDSVSVFKFARRSDNVYKYTINGKLKTGTDESVMTVTPFTMDNPMSDKEIRKTMEGIYKKDGMTGIKVKNESDNKINGYDAYESEVYGKINGKETLIYQLTVSKDGKALLIIGVSGSDFDKNISDFKKLAYTVSFKAEENK